MASGKQQAASGKWQASLNFDIVKDDNGQRKVAPKKMTPNGSGREAWHKGRERKRNGKRMEGEGKRRGAKGRGRRRSGSNSNCGMAHVDELPFERLNPRRRHTKWILSNAANHIEVLSVLEWGEGGVCGKWQALCCIQI